MTAAKAAAVIRILSDRDNRDPRFLASVAGKVVR